MLRRDYQKVQRYHGDTRSPDRLRAHYELERALADRLKSAPAAERSAVYGRVYDELFDSLTDHPQHTKRLATNGRAVGRDVQYIAPFLNKNGSFAEIGCGDAAVSFAVAPLVRNAIGIDVQDKLIDYAHAPPNFRFVKLADGVTFPIESASIDVVSSDQLLEHLHPQDVRAQLHEITRVLKPGGRYICTTPSAVTGPHDITMYFGYTAAGLHLKEYTYREIRDLFLESGFRHVTAALRILGRQIIVPVGLSILAERMLLSLPRSIRSKLGRTRIVDRAMGITVIAQV